MRSRCWAGRGFSPRQERMHRTTSRSQFSPHKVGSLYIVHPFQLVSQKGSCVACQTEARTPIQIVIDPQHLVDLLPPAVKGLFVFPIPRRLYADFDKVTNGKRKRGSLLILAEKIFRVAERAGRSDEDIICELPPWSDQCLPCLNYHGKARLGCDSCRQ